MELIKLTKTKPKLINIVTKNFFFVKIGLKELKNFDYGMKTRFFSSTRLHGVL